MKHREVSEYRIPETQVGNGVSAGKLWLGDRHTIVVTVQSEGVPLAIGIMVPEGARALARHLAKIADEVDAESRGGRA